MNHQEQKALLYDAHHATYQQDLNYWQTLAYQYNGPVLELGCGTGRLLISMLRSGINITGLDNNPAMLAVLRRHLSSAELDQVHLVQSDMTDFDIPVQFGLIFCACNTFSTLNSSERTQTLIQIASHLKPDGCFAASLPNPSILISIADQDYPELEGDFRHPQTGNPVQVSSLTKIEKDQFILQWSYDHLLPDGKVEHTILETRQQILTKEIYLAELELAGLFIQNIWGDFDCSVYTPNSPTLIWEATKRPD